MSPHDSQPTLTHLRLATTFSGTLHALSTLETKIHQYRGIKYATIPARFRQSKLCTAESYKPLTDASKHGPICPQGRKVRLIEEVLFGIPLDEYPVQHLEQDEFECLNLNITCPAGLTPHSNVPVMAWIHGGGNTGSGSEWFYDGGAIVRTSIFVKKPIIFVTFNYRIGLLGFAASNMIRDDNKAAGNEGCGNFGLYDQRTAMQWLQANISAFGGDPSNVTIIGSGSGAADIVCHLLSRHNTAPTQNQPRLFSRAIIQSPVFEPIIQDISGAGWMLSRMTSSLQVGSIEDFRKVEVERLLGLCTNLRVIDDGVWFMDGWAKWFQGEYERGRGSLRHLHGEHLSQSRQTRPGRSGGMGVCTAGATSLLPSSPVFIAKRRKSKSKSRSHSRSAAHNSTRSPSRQHTISSPITPPLRASGTPVSAAAFHKSGTSTTPLQPVIIGDCASDSLLWSLPISLWTTAGVVRRLKALCQSLSKSNGILKAYDFGTYAQDDEIIGHVLDFVSDSRIAWPTDVLAEAILREGNNKVWRYVFDQEGPARGIPHHAADLMYLFDWKPASIGLGSLLDQIPLQATELDLGPLNFWEGPFNVEEESEEKEKPIVSHNPPPFGSKSFEAALAAAAEAAAATVSKFDPKMLASSIISSSSSASSSSSDDTCTQSVEDLDWLTTTVDQFSYLRVRDTMQQKWIAFAYGEEPWTAWSGRHEPSAAPSTSHLPHDPHLYSSSTDNPPMSPTPPPPPPPLPPTKAEKVFIFGPEGEIGERGSAIFDGRRRRTVWREVLEPLGWALVQKLGVELSRGPACAERVR